MTLQEQIRENQRRTVLVLALYALLVAAVAGVIELVWRNVDVLLAFGLLAIGYGVVGWWSAGRVIAAATGAHPADGDAYRSARRALDTVAIAAGLPVTPPLYVVDDPAPNAFAAGRDASSTYVAATTGLLALMPSRELEAVFAHEISHVRNRDVRLMSLAAVLVGVIALVCDLLLRLTLFGAGGRGRRDNGLAVFAMLATAVLAPLAALLLQLALSRRREYQADASAAAITGDAEGMALALDLLRRDTRATRRVSTATAHLFIESPIRQEARRRPGASLFDTHPPLADRIARLEQAGGFRLAGTTQRRAPGDPVLG